MSIGIIHRSFGTHSGSFHADEVTACALLLEFELIDEDKIIRTREGRRLATCDFVCDVGGVFNSKLRRFDHHQVEYQGDLSSAGMVLSYLFEEKIISKKLYDYLNHSLVHGIDQIDNGIWQPILGHCTFSQVVASFVPVSYEALDEEFEEGFYEALEFTRGLIGRLIHKFEYIEKSESVVETLMEQMDECLVFDKAMPWLESFFALGGEHHSAKFIIMPAGEHWKLRGIPPSLAKRMDVRIPLPETWAGLLADDLKKASGLEGGVFCHKGRFVSIWETKEDALRALKIVLRNP